MGNIFSKKDTYIDRVGRSTFDMSFVNNFTTNLGVITPVCCLPVDYGDSFQINAQFNLQLMPTVFPIQTAMYTRLHFVYVRTRTIWSDWMEFFAGDESVIPPYHDPLGVSNADKFNVDDDLQSGTLMDYLNVPTTIVGTYGATSEESAVFPPSGDDIPVDANAVWGLHTNTELTTSLQIDEFVSGKTFVNTYVTPVTDASSYSWIRSVVAMSFPISETEFANAPYYRFILNIKNFNLELNRNPVLAFYKDDGSLATSVSNSSMVAYDGNNLVFTLSKASQYVGFTRVVVLFFADTITSNLKWVKTANPNANYNIYGFASQPWNMQYVITDVTWEKPTKDNCPFYNGNGVPHIPLSSLPARCYEAYYNAYGRDIRNNPFRINGKPEYNKYVPSIEGGPDQYKYKLHYANWEPDAYTTALQSPQAGVAPLVGISSLGEATFRDVNGNQYSAMLETAADGDTVTGFSVRSSDMPATAVANLISMATSGISISDFRNVNSLQRFLEIRIRQSPRYKNLVKGLFDVDLDFDELMMPEFLGGISDNVPVYKVTQTTPTEGAPLGSFAGQGVIQSGMKHVIRKYCPEAGYILGVLSVVPAANYSQLLPPHFTRRSLLDWHFPQFNNVSFQPMTYKNLCPYQSFAVNPQNINNVFGYQRAWWDLVSSFDEVHGEFRGSLRNFVINRVFDQAPELSESFLLVNPDQVNDVFAVTSEGGDKILGSIKFDISKKTSIPRDSRPHIE